MQISCDNFRLWLPGSVIAADRITSCTRCKCEICSVIERGWQKCDVAIGKQKMHTIAGMATEELICIRARITRTTSLANVAQRHPGPVLGNHLPDTVAGIPGQQGSGN